MTAAKLLQNTLSKLLKEPVEGFVCELFDDSNLFKWKVYLEGPKDSPYEGGIFQLLMEFPDDYPMSPPTLRFTSAFWHPNVYEDGKVCISILHAPGEDPMSGELPEERWLPTQSVATIMLSVISMLNDPNISSPANVDASIEWRRDRAAYNKKCKELAIRSRSQVPAGVVIPHPDSDPAERQKAIAKMKEAENEDFELYSYGDDFEESDAEAEEDDGDLEDDDCNGSDEEEGEEEEEEESASLKRKAEITNDDLKKKKKDPVHSLDEKSTSVKLHQENQTNDQDKLSTTKVSTITSTVIQPPPLTKTPTPTNSSLQTAITVISTTTTAHSTTIPTSTQETTTTTTTTPTVAVSTPTSDSSSCMEMADSNEKNEDIVIMESSTQSTTDLSEPSPKKDSVKKRKQKCVVM